MSSPNRRLVDDYFRAINTPDWNLLAAVFHPDIDFRPPGAPPRADRDATLRFYRRVFERFPVHEDQPTRIIDAGDTIVVEIRFVGRSATGVDVDFDAVDIFDFRDGQISRLTQWFDSAALERQMSAG